MVGTILTQAEFKQGRLRVDAARRQALIAAGDRKLCASLHSAAKMPEQVVEAAARSVQDGLTLTEIAAGLWRRHGYASERSCYSSLRLRVARYL